MRVLHKEHLRLRHSLRKQALRQLNPLQPANPAPLEHQRSERQILELQENPSWEEPALQRRQTILYARKHQRSSAAHWAQVTARQRRCPLLR